MHIRNKAASLILKIKLVFMNHIHTTELGFGIERISGFTSMRMNTILLNMLKLKKRHNSNLFDVLLFQLNNMFIILMKT
jgi:hypothetical protein